MLGAFRQAFMMLVVLTLLTGVAYPLLVTAFAQLVPVKAQGDPSLIGQPFSDPKYFWSRPSATGPVPYNAGASSGSNQGPLNPALADAVKARIEALRQADPGNQAPVPVDLITASGSGLDPHITPAAAAYQVARVAKARGLAADQVQALVAEYTEARQLGFLGEPRVNVLKLNLALDGLKS